MPDIKTLRELRVEKEKAARDLNAKDNFTKEDQAAFDAIMGEVENLNNQIENFVRLNGLSSPHDAMTVAAQAADITIANQPPVYRNIGEQMLDVRAMTLDTADAPKARDRFQKIVNAASGASTGIDSEGGYLVETDKAANIYETAIETGVFASRCTVQPISAGADSFSYLAADDRDRSTGKINGIQVYRKGEADTMSSGGKAKLKERELKVEDMYGLVYMTNRMLKDAVAMAGYTKRVLREQLAFKLDQEIFEGNGSGRCLGITASDIMVTVAKEAAQSADTIIAENVVKMLARFKGDISRAAWFVNQDCLPQFPLLKVGDTPVFIPGGQFTGAPFGALLGVPIVPVEFCSTIGDLNDIVLGDFSQYMLVTKGGIEEAESIHVKFLTDETAFRFIVRNNGQPMHDTAITPLKGSNTLSPFVNLAARA